VSLYSPDLLCGLSLGGRIVHYTPSISLPCPQLKNRKPYKFKLRGQLTHVRSNWQGEGSATDRISHWGQTSLFWTEWELCYFCDIFCCQFLMFHCNIIDRCMVRLFLFTACCCVCILLQCTCVLEQRFCWWKFLFYASKHVAAGITKCLYSSGKVTAFAVFCQQNSLK